jgi:heat shock protein HslJ
MKKILVVIVAVVVIGVALFVGFGEFKSTVTDEGGSDSPDPSVPDIMNLTCSVDGVTFVLEDGRAEIESAPGSAIRNSLAVFGEPAYGDLDNDGDTDAAICLVNDPGGSGTFYYAVLAINDRSAYRATDAMLLGDRIAPQSVEIIDGRPVYNFSVRKADEPMSAPATVVRQIWIHYDNETGQIGELVKDFEGEADPQRMTLGMQTWTWISTGYNNDTEVLPADPAAFTLTFNSDMTFSATTDCNSLRGTYTVNNNRIIFGEVLATRMFCENSQESAFTGMLGKVQSYFFTSRGRLVFDLKFDSGSMIFR